jgi:hypothetical protein
MQRTRPQPNPVTTALGWLAGSLFLLAGLTSPTGTSLIWMLVGIVLLPPASHLLQEYTPYFLSRRRKTMVLTTGLLITIALAVLDPSCEAQEGLTWWEHLYSDYYGR